MPINIPPAVNYQSPLIAIPTRWAKAPPEGNNIISCEIDWGTMGGPNGCVNVNLQNNATLTFSQIAALSIDNSSCGADVQFVFPDTTETLTIPAYSPKIITPVFTNQTQFFVYAPTFRSEDVTRFSILNAVPPPIAVPVTSEQNAAVAGDVSLTATGFTQLVSPSVSGTLENAFFNYIIGNGQAEWYLTDSTGQALAGGIVIASTTVFGSGTALDLKGISVRFQGGLRFQVFATSSTSGTMATNLYYRTP